MPQPLYADVIIPVALGNTFVYRVGEKHTGLVKRGSRVLVEFGRSRKYVGVVDRVHNEKPDLKNIKIIETIAGHLPLISTEQLDLWSWISEYYMCTRGEVMDAALPTSLKVGEADSRHYRSREEVFIKLASRFSEKRLHEVIDTLERKPAQRKLLMTYLSMTNYSGRGNPGVVSRSSLLAMAAVTTGPLTSLVDDGVLRVEMVESVRIAESEAELMPANTLSHQQDKALAQIKLLMEEKEVVLLHGVTSSGKTEIYIRMIEEQLKEGRQVLYLLPEIALTAQMINRLKRHFGNSVGVYHSRLSDAGKAEVWRRTAGEFGGHEFKVILGVRSAIFLPYHDLGLIIVDEEHDGSYKQNDPAPRYNARDSATVLAKYHRAKTLLGSATPSVETMFNARSGKYGLAELKGRYGDVKMPEIILADTREAYKRKIMVSHFTPQLIRTMEEALAKGEQIVLLRNRRGFAPFIQCRECGWIPSCQDCSVSLTYHKNLARMVCHYCGKPGQVPLRCENCSSANLEMKGFGTEKIEDELKILFPESTIERMDLDTTRNKGSFERIIRNIEQGRTNILIGTQMISKGLDFEGLTVIGILNVDNMLNFPDFRSHERCFQLIEQVSGRSGRRSTTGKVLIQTSDPTHPVMNQAMHHDYERMYNTQLEERKEFNYPPFTRLIKIFVRHRDMKTVREAAALLAGRLKRSLGKRVLGPEFPLIARVQSYYIMTIMVKIEKDRSVVKARSMIRQSMNEIETDGGFSSIRIYADVDPY